MAWGPGGPLGSGGGASPFSLLRPRGPAPRRGFQAPRRVDSGLSEKGKRALAGAAQPAAGAPRPPGAGPAAARGRKAPRTAEYELVRRAGPPPAPGRQATLEEFRTTANAAKALATLRARPPAAAAKAPASPRQTGMRGFLQRRRDGALGGPTAPPTTPEPPPPRPTPAARAHAKLEALAPLAVPAVPGAAAADARGYPWGLRAPAGVAVAAPGPGELFPPAAALAVKAAVFGDLAGALGAAAGAEAPPAEPEPAALAGLLRREWDGPGTAATPATTFLATTGPAAATEPEHAALLAGQRARYERMLASKRVLMAEGLVVPAELEPWGPALPPAAAHPGMAGVPWLEIPTRLRGLSLGRAPVRA